MPYGVNILRELRRLTGQDLVVVRKDQNRTRGFVPEDEERISFLKRSEQSRDSLLRLYRAGGEISNQNARVDHREFSANTTTGAVSLVYVSGWIDPDYLAVARQARIAGVPVVTGLDNQWLGNLRQRMACLASSWRVHPYFSHVQVAGPRQYEFARRLGFQEEQILFDLYSCDMSVFEQTTIEPRKTAKRFLFVGRFMEKKGLEELYQAWKIVSAESNDWELQLIGGGDELPDFAALPRVILSGFLTPEELAAQIDVVGAVVIPSRKEPWGVVVHEFAAKGLAMILSDAVGAGTAFLIDGYNGFRFRTGDSADLAEKLRLMTKLSDDERAEMGRRSKLLSQRIRPEFSAAQLASLIER